MCYPHSFIGEIESMHKLREIVITHVPLKNQDATCTFVIGGTYATLTHPQTIVKRKKTLSR